GRPDPHGPVLALRNGAPRRDEGPLRSLVRMRHGSRPARDSHEEHGTDAPQPLPGGRHSPVVSEPTVVGKGGGGRKDRGEQLYDRSRHGEAGPEAPRGAGRIQMVCRRVARRLAGIRGGEESAGASFLRTDGTVWTTDKDGFIPCLLAAEITSRTGRDPGEIYRSLTDEFGEPFYDRVDAPATPGEKAALSGLSRVGIRPATLAGENVLAVLTRAPGNGAPIGGIKVVTQNGWFAARPSGTEDVYKIYAESFLGDP